MYLLNPSNIICVFSSVKPLMRFIKVFLLIKNNPIKRTSHFQDISLKKDQNPSKSESHFLSVYQVICYNDDAFSSLAPLWYPLWDATPRAMPFSAKRQTFEKNNRLPLHQTIWGQNSCFSSDIFLFYSFAFKKNKIINLGCRSWANLKAAIHFSCDGNGCRGI